MWHALAVRPAAAYRPRASWATAVRRTDSTSTGTAADCFYVHDIFPRVLTGRALRTVRLRRSRVPWPHGSCTRQVLGASTSMWVCVMTPLKEPCWPTALAAADVPGSGRLSPSGQPQPVVPATGDRAPLGVRTGECPLHSVRDRSASSHRRCERDPLAKLAASARCSSLGRLPHNEQWLGASQEARTRRIGVASTGQPRPSGRVGPMERRLRGE